MDYRKWILEKLVFKYENSRSFAVEVPSRRITIDFNYDILLASTLKNPTEKQKFMKALESLKNSGIIGYAWDVQEGNVRVHKVWLLPSDQGIRACYGILNREYKKDTIRELSDLLEAWGQGINPLTPMGRFIEEMRVYLKEQHKIPRFFEENSGLNADIIRCMAYLEKNEDEILEQQLSLELYEDRSYFEEKIKKKVLSILKYVKRKENEEAPAEEELLREKGVTRWPEIMEFCGKIEVVFQNEEKIDYDAHRLGAYMNSEMVRSIQQISMKSIKRVLFVENKDNYLWYLKYQKKPDELVLLHGRCMSPMKRRWFEKIYTDSKKQDNSIEFCHWGDVDVEGIRIFSASKNNVIPVLLSYKMDLSILQESKDKVKKLPTLSYFRKLREMRKDAYYSYFWDVIDEMHRCNVMLKQTDLLY